MTYDKPQAAVGGRAGRVGGGWFRATARVRVVMTHHGWPIRSRGLVGGKERRRVKFEMPSRIRRDICCRARLRDAAGMPQQQPADFVSAAPRVRHDLFQQQS